MAATLTPPTPTFSIREAAGLLAVSAHTLRYYDRMSERGVVSFWPTFRPSRARNRRQERVGMEWVTVLFRCPRNGRPFHERAGLLDAVPRAGSSHRQYTEREIEALRFVLRLRATGMPITAIRQYMALVREGEGTQATRQALLEAHKARVQANIARLTQDLGAIQKKLDSYGCQTPPSGKAGKA